MESLIEPVKGDLVLDYRNGVNEMTERTHKHLANGGYGEAKSGRDAGMGCDVFFDRVISPGGIFNVVMPTDFELPNRTRTTTMVGSVHRLGALATLEV